MRRALRIGSCLLALSCVGHALGDLETRPGKGWFLVDGGWMSPNLVPNPSVESGRGNPKGWSFTAIEGGGAWESEGSRTGRRMLAVSGSGAWRSRPFPLEPGLITFVSAESRQEGPARWGSQLRISYLDAKGARIEKLDNLIRDEHGWQRMEVAGAAPEGTVSGVVVAYLAEADVRAWYDDFEVRQWKEIDPVSTEVREPAVGLLGFDLGTADSAVQPGYRRVAPSDRYRDSRGFGWVGEVHLSGSDQTATQYRSSEVNRHGEPANREQTLLDSLTRDNILGRGGAGFRVNVPAGAYQVFVLAGHNGRELSLPYFDLAVSLGGKRVGILAKHFPSVGHVWGTYRSTAGKNGLLVGLAPEQTDGPWSVAALLLIPEGLEPAGRAEIARILRSVQEVPEGERGKWRRVPTRRQWQEPPAAEQPQAGAVSAVFPLVAEVLPSTPLSRGRSVGQLRAAAAPGLSADMTWTLRVPDAWEQLSVTLDPFVGPDNARLPSEAITLRAVERRAVRYNRIWVDPAYYRLAADALTAQLPTRLDKEESRRFWIHVRIPEDTAPGFYRSSVRWSAVGREPMAIPVEVRVLPFRVESELGLFQNLYYYGQAGSVTAPEGSALRLQRNEFRDASVRDQMEHMGEAAASLGYWPVFRQLDDRWAVDVSFARQKLADFRRAGHPATSAIISLHSLLANLAIQLLPAEETRKLTRHLDSLPAFTEHYWTVLGDLLLQIDAMLIEEGVADRQYNPVDEPRGPDLDLFVEVARVLGERLGEPSIFCNVAPWLYYETEANPGPALGPWCNVWWVYGTLTDEQREIELLRGTRLMGRFEVRNPARARAAAGLLRWRRRETGGNWWSYDALLGSMNTHLDGRSPGDRCMVYPTVPPSPRAVWEAARLGHEDLRYLVTLERKLSGEAGQCLALASALEGGRHLVMEIEELDPTNPEPFLDLSEYDRFRGRLVSALEEIHRAETSCLNEDSR